MTQILALSSKKEIPSNSYLRLRSQVKAVLSASRKRAEELVEHEKVKTYLKVGLLIDRHILKHKGRADYGKQVIERLARDLGMNRAELYFALEFARSSPIVSARRQLPWRHHRTLLSINDKDKREALRKEAMKEGWSSRTLEQKVGAILRHKALPSSNDKNSKSFIPRRGKMNTYRIVADNNVLYLDLGFTVYLELNKKQTKNLKEGDIVRGTSLSKLKKVSPNEKANLYTYAAPLERVVDADTDWMKIRLGFGIVLREKLRLRGIDAPELNTKAGQRAKKFVEKFFSSSSETPLITTTKPDKYDRYLSDIWLGDTNLNLLLLQKGLARLKTTVRPSDWE